MHRRALPPAPAGRGPTFVVVATAYVVPPPAWNRPPYVEVVVGYDHDPAHARQTFATRDAAIADAAIAAEGTDTRFALRAAGALDGARTVVRQLVALEVVA
jgi:hypothetical protein